MNLLFEQQTSLTFRSQPYSEIILKNINFLLFFLLLTGFLIGAPIPYSGKVAINGANFQGDAQFTFALRDANGTEHWRNGANANDSIELTVDRGLYVCLLGGNTMNDFPAKLFLNHSELYLQVRFYRVDTQKWLHLLPDQRITSAPHALAAEVANLAKLADAVRPGAITKSMLGDEVLADLNRTVTKSMLGQDVLADLNQTIGTDSITLDKLSPQVRADLNGTIARSRFPSDVLADLNRTVTKSMLGQDVLADLNQTIGTDSITLDKLSPQVRADLNRTVTATDIAANTITTAQLNESILRYLKPEITQSPQAPARVYTGQTVTLASQSEGKYLTYQWKKNGIDLSGETNATLIITEANATLHDGNYTLEVSNDFGSVSAQSVTLDVNATAILHHVQSASNLEMLWVSSGTFTMGSPTSEAGRGTNEDEHTATLTNGFYLGKYEVTQVQYEAVMTGNSNQLSATPSQWPGNANRPVEKVSWNDVQVFLTRLNAAEQAAGRLPTGWSYVLPTESEWEYACRAGATTVYSWGNSIAASNANYSSSAINQTRDVGQYAANPWGFFDMHGNVFEWTADRYAISYPTGSATDPIGPTTGSSRVQRGGSWFSTASDARSAIRSGSEPAYRNKILGFRVGFRYAGGVSQLSLLGDANATHVGGMAWVDPGFTATDAEDGNLTSQVTVTGAVNANATGTYVLHYTVMDSKGNIAATTRTVNVTGTHTVEGASNLQMLWVEPGAFTMGSPTSEAGRGTNEDEHTATLTNGFYLGKYEVTQTQYEAVMTGNSNSLSATPSQWPGNANRPVEKVSWNDVQVFLTRLNAAEQAAGRLPTGWSYVLPTESEWEYACRAGATTVYSWGNSIAASNANYSSSAINQTRDVGQYAANPWGFFDMHGNVFEWTADRYAISYPTGSATDPIGPTTGSSRVQRGGSWFSTASDARSAIRSGSEPAYRNKILGFRVGFRYAGGVSQLSLLGDANATHVGGMAWVDPGFTATDAEDGNLTSQVTVTGAVNANATGTYVLHYTVMDSKGNIAATTRTVNVSMAATRVVAGASNLQMLWVEPGTFTMGSPTSEAGRVTSETEHNVTLTNGFYLGKYEVTQAQYEAVMTGNSNSLSATPSQWPGNANRPVEKVSWSDIQVFLTRLNAAEQAAGRLSAGWQYVLPTESEWEYACRAGITTAYSWGNDVNSTHANWDYGNDANQTVNVGQYAANPWGFYDMHGNVWEWLNDWKANYPGGAQTDPEGPASGSHRVKRGGSWNYPGSYLRSAKRNLSTPGTRVNSLGFRVGFKAVQPDVGNPELDLFGGASITREASQPWIDPDFEAHDVRDGILTASVTVSGTVDMNSTGTYVLTYSVSDAAGNGANATRTVTVADTTAPVVTLLGDANFTHTKDVAWVDPGATVTDTLDGNLTNQVTISGTVDVNSTGAYVLTYSVSDGAGNEANATRTVNVGMAATYVVEGASNLQMLWVEPGTFTMGSPERSGRGTRRRDASTRAHTTVSTSASTRLRRPSTRR